MSSMTGTHCFDAAFLPASAVARTPFLPILPALWHSAVGLVPAAGQGPEPEPAVGLVSAVELVLVPAVEKHLTLNY